MKLPRQKILPAPIIGLAVANLDCSELHCRGGCVLVIKVKVRERQRPLKSGSVGRHYVGRPKLKAQAQGLP